MDALHVHWTRPEVCIGEIHGLMLGLYVAAVRTEWLPSIRGAVEASAARNGGPVPALAVFRLDPRFPIEFGFDSNVGELGATLRALRSSMSACSTIVEFGGVLGGTMRSAVAALSLFSGGAPAVAAHSTAIEGLQWLAPRIDLTRADEYLGALQQMRTMLGSA